MNAFTLIFAFLLGGNLVGAAAYEDKVDRREAIKSLAFAAWCVVMMGLSVVIR